MEFMRRKRDAESLRTANQELQKKISDLIIQIESLEANVSSEKDSIMEEISDTEKQIEQKQRDIRKPASD